MNPVLTLWDSDTPPHDLGQVYTWNGYLEEDSIHSVFRYVEAHGERLRRKYVAWVHDLGESRIRAKRLIDHLALKDGLSYWWMTVFAEKSPWKSPSVIDAIRLLALEEIIAKQQPEKLRLVSANPTLHQAVSDLCKNLGIDYDWERLREAPLRRWSIRSVYRAVPRSIRALLSLMRYLRVYWPLGKARQLDWLDGDRTVFFCSYFNNVDYWGGLTALVERMGFQGNWLELFVPGTAFPTASSLSPSLHRLNQEGRGKTFHALLHAYLSWRMVFSVLKGWVWLAVVSSRLHAIKRAFRPAGSHVSLWPVMREDWFDAMYGATAISNLLWIRLFDAALRDLPHHKKGLYLCENQAWERALVHAWRKYGHGRLIAVAHATVRFWDLRYFIDPRTLRSSDSHPMPRADFISLNGKPAIDAYLSMDYPKEAIVECEALRYTYLNRSRAVSGKARGDVVKIVILGDYIASSTIKLLKLLEAAVPKLSVLATYTVKAHANCPVKPADYPVLNLELSTAPMGEILHDYDIAYASNMTSAAVDAYLVGLPVVVMLDDTELNLSPLRGKSGVRFVTTSLELADVLGTIGDDLAADRDCSDFFFMDPELPRWRRLLSEGMPL